MTGALFIADDALRMNTKYDIRWDIVQPISKHIPTPSLVSLSNLSIIFIGWVFFHLNHTWRVSPVIIFILSHIYFHKTLWDVTVTVNALK